MDTSWVSKLKDIRAKALEDIKRKSEYFSNQDNIKIVDSENIQNFIDNLQSQMEGCAYYDPYDQILSFHFVDDQTILGLVKSKLNSLGFTEIYLDDCHTNHISSGLEFCLKHYEGDETVYLTIWVGSTIEEKYNKHTGLNCDSDSDEHTGLDNELYSDSSSGPEF